MSAMAEEIDESKRKPRRTKGTPSYYYRNRFALGFLLTGCTLFAAFACTPIFKVANEKIFRSLEPSEEQISRKYLFSFLPRKRGEDIRKALQEEEDFRKDR